MPDIELMGVTYPDVPAVDLPKSGGGLTRFYDPTEINYAGSATSGGSASNTEGIPYAAVDGTSTSTAFTATVPGITELKDGTVMLLKNGVVTSASGFTINVNNLGAKPVYSNMAAATADTTIFNINYTMLFIYDTTRVTGGCWICYRGYNSDTNTIGYQLRGNSATMPVSAALYRYRIMVTSLDGKNFIPVNSTNSSSADTQKTTTTSVFDPFGEIRYYSGTGTVASGSRPTASALWQQYAFNLGYSFNTTGAALSLTSWRPVYLRLTPQASGGVKFSSTPYTQSLPSTNDNRLYLLLGIAYNATNVEMLMKHPIYYHDGVSLKQWTGDKLPIASDATPQALGTASAGTSTDYSRADHVHAMPSASDVGAMSDFSSAPLSGGEVPYYSSGSWYPIGINDAVESSDAIIIPIVVNGSSCHIAYDFQSIAQKYQTGRKVIFASTDGSTFVMQWELKYADLTDGRLELTRIDSDGDVVVATLYPDANSNYEEMDGTIYGNSKIAAPSNPADGQILVYRSASGAWQNYEKQSLLESVSATIYTITESNNVYHIDADLTDIFAMAQTSRKVAFVHNVGYQYIFFEPVYTDFSSGELTLFSASGMYNNYMLTLATDSVNGGMSGTLTVVETGYGKLDIPGSANVGDVLGYTANGWEAVTPPNTVTYTRNNSVSVAGTTKTTYTYGQSSIYTPNGIIIGGSAADAGLVTRGVCGINSPSAGGACQKDNLYLNYDGDNTYRSNRQVIIQAGATGTHYGSNLYQYAAARGDAVKGYIDSKVTNYGMLPTPASGDEGKVLRVVSGAWTAVSLPSASGVSF